MSQQNTRQEQIDVQEPSVAVTDPQISRLNQKYASKITSGDILLTAENGDSRQSPQDTYNSKTKNKRLSLAQKEKQSLEKKLEYLNRSIQSIKDYDYSTGRPALSSSPKSKSPPVDPIEIIKKNRQFHEKVREEKRLRKERIKAEQKRHQQKVKQQLEEQKKKQQEEKARKKQEIFNNMQKLKQRMQTRQAQMKKRQEDYHKVIGTTTLFKKIQKQQALNQSHVLEQRKKKLANIRNLHRPVSIVQIQEHQRKFFEALKEKESLRQQERRLNNAFEEYRVSYKSPKHRDYSMELHHEDINESKIKFDKMRQFSEHVRENFVPHVDERKKSEITKQMQTQEEKKRKRAQKEEQSRHQAQQIKNKGLRYLEQLRDLPKGKSATKSKITPNTVRPHYTNYLTHSQHIGKPKWGSILDSNVSRRDKAIRLQMQAQKMEGTLKMKEQKARLLHSDPDDVDQEYYEMVKAKLELLQY